jgi:hypothetical protein
MIVVTRIREGGKFAIPLIAEGRDGPLAFSTATGPHSRTSNEDAVRLHAPHNEFVTIRS